MKTLREPDTLSLRLQSLSDSLHRIQGYASQLQTLAHQTAMLAMAASASVPQVNVRPADLRRAMNSFGQVVGNLRQAETALLARVPANSRPALAAALEPEAMAVFDEFLNLTRGIDAQIDGDDPGPSAGCAELFRFINDDLSRSVSALSDAVSAALAELRQDDLNLALLDDLTELPNRRALYRMAARLWSPGTSSQPLALVRLDLDHFKAINDKFGHAAGDAVLVRASQTIKQQLREGDFVARVGGDEFVMILPGTLEDIAIAARLERLIAALSQPHHQDGEILRISVSAGIANQPAGSNFGVDRLLHNADLALYAAKAAGRGRYHFFTNDLRVRHETALTLTDQIRAGIEAGQFVPYFQPQVEGRTGRLVGLEALARWHHPERGVLTPYHFLDAARAQGLLEALDEQITDAAINALRTWRDMGLPVPQVSINISSERLVRAGLSDALGKAVRDAGLTPDAIGLEILETAMIESSSLQMIETVQSLSRAGFQVELDDFGTGHASIANLRHFKVDRIKIDRSFIKDIHLHGELSKITAAMIGLAHSLRVDALGEGVETPEERLILNALGIDYIQGYGVARPMPQDEVEDWIKRTQGTRSLPAPKATTG